MRCREISSRKNDLVELANVLDLPAPIEDEGFDISNISGTLPSVFVSFKTAGLTARIIAASKLKLSRDRTILRAWRKWSTRYTREFE